GTRQQETLGGEGRGFSHVFDDVASAIGRLVEFDGLAAAGSQRQLLGGFLSDVTTGTRVARIDTEETRGLAIFGRGFGIASLAILAVGILSTGASREFPQPLEAQALNRPLGVLQIEVAIDDEQVLGILADADP